MDRCGDTGPSVQIPQRMTRLGSGSPMSQDMVLATRSLRQSRLLDSICRTRGHAKARVGERDFCRNPRAHAPLQPPLDCYGPSSCTHIQYCGYYNCY